MCHRLAHSEGPHSIVMDPRAVVYHNVVAERVTWNYLWRRCFFVNKGKVKAFANMGAAANMDADVKFAVRSLWRNLRQGARDLTKGDFNGVSRFAVLIAALALATSGNIAGRLAERK